MSQEDQSKITINNKKALLCSRAFLQKRDRSENQVYFSKNNLLKYFPKYIHKLVVDTRGGPIISKVKRVKILHGFENFLSSNLRRTLLYNKEKQIQGIYYETYRAGLLTGDSRHLIREIKALPGLQSLALISGQFEKWRDLKIICKYMKSMTKLQLLNIQILGTNPERYLNAISMINSYERVLEALETLKIDCVWEEDPDPEYQIIILKGLLKNKNVLKSSTHLNLGTLNHQEVFELFEKILACCPKLVSLWFETDKPKPEDNSWDDSPTEEEIPQYLKALGRLNNLQAVDIVVSDVLTFLSDFTLPPSIQEVTLGLIPFETSMLRDTQVLATFYDKWSPLINLKTLRIRIGQYFDSKALTPKFIQSWLKKVNPLQNLCIELSSDVPNKSPWGGGLFSMQGDLDISAFLESIQHFKETLESLILTDNRRIYNMKNLPENPFEFPRLYRFGLQGLMPSQEFEVQRLFQTNLSDLLMKGNNEKPFELLLSGLNFDSLGSLLLFIQNFDQERSDQQRTLTIAISAFLKNDTSGKVCENFILVSNRFSIQVTVFSSEKLDQSGSGLKLLVENGFKVLRLVQ